METSERIATVDAIHEEARQQGLYFLHAEDEELRGPHIHVRGKPLLAFASCSYLGLEHHPALVAGVVRAVTRFGTQFSATRGFVSAPPYAEVEALMSELMGGHAVVCSSTSLAHQAALGVLATEKDAIVLDHQAHHSIHQAALLARTAGCHVEVVRHGELERALDAIRRLAVAHRTVWFAVDGVYSMYGDLVPIELVREALELAPNVRLYVDDAHGMSWAGTHGRGSFLSRMALDERIVLATSLSKGFAAGGACLVFASDHERQRVRRAGGPLFFSGPLQPPMLGAVMASARLHLSPAIRELQARLADRVALANRRIRSAGLPLLVENESPICFLRLGVPRLAFQVARRMMDDGIYVTPSVYPTVPLRRGGIRLSITAAHRAEDVTRVVDRLAEHVPAVLAAEGLTLDALDQEFANALPGTGGVRTSRGASAHGTLVARRAADPAQPGGPVHPGRPAGAPAGLVVERCTSIRHIDAALWNSLLGTAGFISWDSLVMQEQVFGRSAEPENTWEFRYVIVRDATRVVAAAVFTVALCKDDMLMRAEVSRAVEDRRKADPYFLSSRTLLLGTLLSEGNHLYLDRAGPWRAALGCLLEVAREACDRAGCSAIVLRDLPDGDAELDAEMLHHGLVKAPMLDSHVLPITWRTDDEYVAALHKPAQRRAARERIAQSRQYERRLHGVGVGALLSPGELDHLYALYLGVAAKGLRMNVFQLPARLLAAMQESPAWELVTLRLDPAHGGPAHGRPVAFFAGHKQAGHYGGFLCGVDYGYVLDHGAYRQMLQQLIRRAQELGMTTLRLGVTADREKLRLGSVVQRNCVYLQAQEDFHAAVLREIAAEASLDRESARGSSAIGATPPPARPAHATPSP